MSLTKAMAQEWGGDSIRVNAVCPGLVQTKFSAALWQDEQTLQRFLGHVPLGRIGQPEDIVGLAIYLAGDAGRYCTGAVFTVDGGYFAEMVAAKKVQKFSITARQVTLYLGDVKPGDVLTFEYSLKPKYPVKVKTPATVAYEYYTPANRVESKPAELTVEETK